MLTSRFRSRVPAGPARRWSSATVPPADLRVLRGVRVTVLATLLAPLAVATSAHAYSESCSGGSCTQRFDLAAGWNAVWLEVQPASDDAESVFTGLPLLSAWTWNPTRSIEFVQDPSEQVLQTTEFLGYFPPERPESFVNNLRRIKSHRPYLIRLSAPAQWVVTGRPSLRATQWIPSSYNLVGMPVDPVGPAPTFGAYFRGSSAHAGRAAYRLAADGAWSPVSPGTAMRTGEAFWIWTEGASSFGGPFQIEIPLNDGLDFGASLDRLPLRVHNRDLAALALSLEAGEAVGKLGYQRSTPQDLDEGPPETGFPPLPSPLAVDVPLDRPWLVELALLRETVDAPVEAVTTLRGAGARRWIPFHALPGAGSMRTAAPLAPTGLWIGTIKVNRVAEIHHPNAPTDPSGYRPCACGQPAFPEECSCTCGADEAGNCKTCPNELELRVILHVDTGGQVRLLKEVVQACDRSSGAPDDLCAVLATDAARVAGLEGVSRRDGTAVPLRLSAASFDFDASQADAATGGLPVSGSLLPGAALTATLLVPESHPTNPYRHAYHRDLGGDCGCIAGDTACVDRCAARFRFGLARAIELKIDASDPSAAGGDAPHLGWQTRRLIGCYSEQVTGLHRLPVNLGGRVRLVRVSTVGDLR